MTDSFSGLLARIRVDEPNGFGKIEWRAPMPTNREAEQGNVDGPLECSLVLGMLAAETRAVAFSMGWCYLNCSI